MTELRPMKLVLIFYSVVISMAGCNQKSSQDLPTSKELKLTEKMTDHSPREDAAAEQSKNLSEAYSWLEMYTGNDFRHEDMRKHITRDYKQYERWVVDEVKKHKKYRKQFDDLGCVHHDSGIETGHVTVCGYLLSPPYVVECQRTPDKLLGGYRYILTVNGVLLNFTSRYSVGCLDEPETPRKKPSTPSEKREHQCAKRIGDIISGIRTKVDRFPEDTAIEVVEEIVRDGTERIKANDCVLSAGYRNMNCPKGGGRCGAPGFMVSYTIKGTHSRGHHHINLPGAMDQAKLDAQREGLEFWSGRQCKEFHEKVVKALERGELVQENARNSQGKMLRFITAVARAKMDLTKKYWLLEKLGAVCPPCFIANQE
jgi:hypothetical protein